MKIPESLTEKEIIEDIKIKFRFSDRIRLALKQAKKSHKKQFREDGKPKLNEHIYPVTKMVIDFFGDKISENIIISSLLHDALEDDEELEPGVFIELFGEDAYGVVSALSKPNLPGLKSLSETDSRNAVNKKYFDRLSKSRYEIKIIKLLDRIDNLYWAMTFGEELVKIYIRETEEFFLPFAKTVDKRLYEDIKFLLSKLKRDAKLMNWA